MPLEDITSHHITSRHSQVQSRNKRRFSIATLVTVLKPIAAEAGRELVCAGAAAHAIFLLVSGIAEEHVPAHDLRFFLTPGSSFGELAALGCEPAYHESVVAVEPCDLYLIQKQDLFWIWIAMKTTAPIQMRISF